MVMPRPEINNLIQPGFLPYAVNGFASGRNTMPVAIVSVDGERCWQPRDRRNFWPTLALFVTGLLNWCGKTLLPNIKNARPVLALPLSQRRVTDRTLDYSNGPIPIEHSHTRSAA